MVNVVIVRIIAERIMKKGVNPLKQRPFELDDVVNVDYRKAVEDFIIVNSGVVE